VSVLLSRECGFVFFPQLLLSVTCEPFYDKECDIRIQKVGNHFRAYERRSSNWKTNVGSSILTEVDPKPHWKNWCELVSQQFGGMDIMTIDVMRLHNGDEVIIEINDTSSGFAPDNKEVDTRHVVELAYERAEQLVKNSRANKLHAIGKKGLK
jgi:hypothetical protein